MQSQAAAHNPNTSAVQLDKWSRELAPLSDGARSSVNTLADWINKSLNGHKQDAGAAGARQGRENGQQDARMDISQRTPRPSSPAQDSATAQPQPQARTHDSLARPSLPTAPISDASAFLSWYNAQQSHIASSSSSHHQDTIRALGEARERADETLSQLEAARIHVAELRAGSKFVQEGSEGLREEAESMAEQMDHLSTLSDELALRLSYFAILPSSTTFLSSPSLSLVLSPDFLYTLDRLDVGLQFLRAHPDYHDAAVYKMRFEHCVVRAGQLIRLHVTSTFKSVVGETLVKLKEWEKSRWSKAAGEKETQDQSALMDLGDPVLHTLLYDRFNEEAQQMRPLLLELEKRSAPSAPAAASLDVSDQERDKQPPMDESALLADYAAKAKVDSTEGDATELQEESSSAAVFSAPEFDAMLVECRTAYFEARQTLLLGIVGSCVARIEAAAQTLASATASTSRAHASLLPPLVRQGLAFLAPVCESERSLCARFFATQTAAEATFLSTLCGPLHDRVCSRVQRENNVAIVSQVCVALLEPVDRLEHTALLSPLIRPMLKDAQAQLSMRARTLSLGPEIANFKPSADDLDYPTKLGGAAAAAHRRAQSSIGGAGLLEAAAEAEAARSRGASEASRDSKMGLARAQEGKAATTSVRLFASPAPSVVRTWYTPVSRTLTMLSLLHIALPTKLFCELAMIAVDGCRHALLHGAEKMGSDGNSIMPGRIGATGRMDPPLFLLRHFLLLREMVASVELSTSAQGQGQADRMAVALGDGNAVQHSTSVIDFALLTSVVNALWATTSALLDPRGLLRGSATVDEEPVLNRTPTPRSPSRPFDAAQSEALTRLEHAIKSASAQLVDVISSSVCLPVRVFMDQARRAKVALPASASPTTSSKMSADKIKGVKEAFDTCARTTLSQVKLALAAYIEEERVIDSLVEPILTRIVQTYQAFVDVVQENTANAASEQQAPKLAAAEEVQRELRKLIQR
ncbi:Subunit of cis-Golgi transport vesicle tethering complex-Sec34p [Ceraceosorus bombacis]|uniref:Conserved oligomeric Golgi complex subunit 3 n=1 Tax=Ceraceosorus bombacis TaxID=401625 RepID=A0A0P1BEE8_9BASI|nr:Subunit of cis-Golgi transport vesicle tethering complex-Sec34p [Ceraceosorus bombacis]